MYSRGTRGVLTIACALWQAYSNFKLHAIPLRSAWVRHRLNRHRHGIGTGVAPAWHRHGTGTAAAWHCRGMALRHGTAPAWHWPGVALAICGARCFYASINGMTSFLNDGLPAETGR